MNPNFKILMNEALETGDQGRIDAMATAIENELFHVEIIQTLSGQFAMGCSMYDINGETISMPCVYGSANEVEDLIAEGREQYASQIESGDRDADDEYEGEPMLMKWDGGSNVVFLSADGEHELESGDWLWHAGHD